MEIELGIKADIRVTPTLINKLENYFYEEAKKDLKETMVAGIKDIFEAKYIIQDEEDYLKIRKIFDSRGYPCNMIMEQLREFMIENIFPEEVFDYRYTNGVHHEPYLFYTMVDQKGMEIILKDRGEIFKELLYYGKELLVKVMLEEINKWEVKNG